MSLYERKRVVREGYDSLAPRSRAWADAVGSLGAGDSDDWRGAWLGAAFLWELARRQP